MTLASGEESAERLSLCRLKEPMVGLKAVTNRVKNAVGVAPDLAVYNKILEGCHAAKEPAHMAMSVLEEMQVGLRQGRHA